MQSLDMYSVMMKRDSFIYRTKVWAVDMNNATDIAYDQAIEKFGIYPQDWDDVEIIYQGED